MKSSKPNDPHVGVVAQPRRPLGTGTYLGEELAPKSSRPGAYDAMKLPSLFSGRRYTPGEQAPSSAAPRYLPPPPAAAPVPPPPPAVYEVSPKESDMSYTPRVGSVPARVIQALMQLRTDDFLTNEEIGKECGVQASSVPAHLHTPISRGALIRVSVHGKNGYALPTFVASKAPAPAAAASCTGPTPSLPSGIGPEPTQAAPQSGAAANLPPPPLSPLSVDSAEDQLLQMAAKPAKAVRPTADFAAALWADGALELHGVAVPDDGCGYLRLTADQVKQIARLLGGLTVA